MFHDGRTEYGQTRRRQLEKWLIVFYYYFYINDLDQFLILGLLACFVFYVVLFACFWAAKRFLWGRRSFSANNEEQQVDAGTPENTRHKPGAESLSNKTRQGDVEDGTVPAISDVEIELGNVANAEALVDSADEKRSTDATATKVVSNKHAVEKDTNSSSRKRSKALDVFRGYHLYYYFTPFSHGCSIS